MGWSGERMAIVAGPKFIEWRSGCRFSRIIRPVGADILLPDVDAHREFLDVDAGVGPGRRDGGRRGRPCSQLRGLPGGFENAPPERCQDRAARKYGGVALGRPANRVPVAHLLVIQECSIFAG